MTISKFPPLPPVPSRRTKKYNLLITVFGSHHGSGAGFVSHIFGEYDSLEECKNAGIEAKENYSYSNLTFLNYTCVPIYKKV